MHGNVLHLAHHLQKIINRDDNIDRLKSALGQRKMKWGRATKN